MTIHFLSFFFFFENTWFYFDFFFVLLPGVPRGLPLPPFCFSYFTEFFFSTGLKKNIYIYISLFFFVYSFVPHWLDRVFYLPTVIFLKFVYARRFLLDFNGVYIGRGTSLNLERVQRSMSSFCFVFLFFFTPNFIGIP